MVLLIFVFILMMRPPPISTLFPFTTLFRSPVGEGRLAVVDVGDDREVADAVHAAPDVRPASTAPSCAHLARRPLGLLRSEEHTSELQSRQYLVCRLLLEKKKIVLGVRDKNR